MNRRLRQIIRFLNTDLWRIRTSDLSRPRSFLLNQLRVIILAVRGYSADQCSLRASALTFYSLLAIVPVVAMAFGIAKGFGMEERFKERLRAALRANDESSRPPEASQTTTAPANATTPPASTTRPPVATTPAIASSPPAGTTPPAMTTGPATTSPARAGPRAPVVNPQRQVAERIIQFAEQALEQTRGGVVAGIGVAVLLWTVVKVLGHVEISFNHIWGVKKSRTLGRKFTDYVSIVLVCPILLVVSSSATVVLTAKAAELIRSIEGPAFLVEAVVAVLSLTPFVIGWLLFGFLYTFIPNTRVTLHSALIAGMVAGTMFQLTQWGYFRFQIGVAKYSAIYGSLAALPLFLLWMQISWMIVLFGAELSFAHQNVRTYEFEPDCDQASNLLKRLIALRLTQLLVRSFADDAGPMSAEQLSDDTGAPIRLVNELLFELVEAGILSETASKGNQQTAYQPARTLDKISVASVINVLDEYGSEDLPLAESDEMKRLEQSLQRIRQAAEESAANVALKDV
jgi:membrane protein